MPGGFDQHVAEFLAAFLGDVAGAVGLPAVMHAGGQSAVADELFGGGKAGDVTDRSQDRHRHWTARLDIRGLALVFVFIQSNAVDWHTRREPDRRGIIRRRNQEPRTAVGLGLSLGLEPDAGCFSGRTDTES